MSFMMNSSSDTSSSSENRKADFVFEQNLEKLLKNNNNNNNQNSMHDSESEESAAEVNWHAPPPKERIADNHHHHHNISHTTTTTNTTSHHSPPKEEQFIEEEHVSTPVEEFSNIETIRLNDYHSKVRQTPPKQQQQHQPPMTAAAHTSRERYLLEMLQKALTINELLEEELYFARQQLRERGLPERTGPSSETTQHHHQHQHHHNNDALYSSEIPSSRIRPSPVELLPPHRQTHPASTSHELKRATQSGQHRSSSRKERTKSRENGKDHNRYYTQLQNHQHHNYEMHFQRDTFNSRYKSAAPLQNARPHRSLSAQERRPHLPHEKYQPPPQRSHRHKERHDPLDTVQDVRPSSSSRQKHSSSSRPRAPPPKKREEELRRLEETYRQQSEYIISQLERMLNS